MGPDPALLEQRLHACNRLLQLPMETAESDMLQMAVDMAVELTDSAIGYVHFVNLDQNTIELCTWSTGTADSCAASYEQHYPVADAGIWADSAVTRTPQVHNDYLAEPNRRGLPEGHIDLRRHLVVPVLAAGGVRLLMGVGNKVEPYGHDDVETAQIIADQAWEVALRLRQHQETRARLDLLGERHSGVELTLWDWDPVTGSLSWDPSAGSLAACVEDPDPDWDALREVLDQPSRAALDRMLHGPHEGQVGLRLQGVCRDGNPRVLRLDAAWGDRLRGPGRILRGTLINITALEAARDAEFRDTHDAVTGLPNRAWLLKYLKRHVGDGPNRRQGALALHFIEIDGFTSIGDMHGSDVGDRVLSVLSDRLLHLVRDTDTVGRLGGDGFLIVQAGPVDEQSARSLAERTREDVSQPLQVPPYSGSLSARTGIAIWRAGAAAEQLLTEADRALAEAKRTDAAVVIAG